MSAWCLTTTLYAFIHSVRLYFGEQRLMTIHAGTLIK